MNQHNVYKPNKDLDPMQVKLKTLGYPIPLEPLSSSEKSLCTAILVQAILDYQELTQRGVTLRKSKGGRYSKNEITTFFHSDWCQFLLEQLGGHYTGEQILSIIKKYKR